MKINKPGFTLVELLITLVVIGIVAAVTVPIINTQIRKEEYRSSLFKAISLLNQVALKYYNIYGENPKCGYWLKNPYYMSGNGAQCVSRNDKGNCTGWKLKDGSALPNDYNGFFEDCNKLWKTYYETLTTMKICKNNAYANGCIPKYKGLDEIYAASHSDMSDYDVTVATSSGAFPNQDRILRGSAIVLNDGMIIFTYLTENATYFAVDVNGQKGPNKWGTDVYAIQPKMVDRYSPPVFYPNEALIDKGGLSVKNLLHR